MSSIALLQPLVEELMPAINGAIIAGGSPAGWLGSFDTEAPVQADGNTSPPPYAVMTVEDDPVDGYFDKDTTYRVTYCVSIVTLRKQGAGFCRTINDKLMSMHDTFLSGTTVSIQCMKQATKINIMQDTYEMKSYWKALGSP